jgi:hypothetical protein
MANFLLRWLYWECGTVPKFGSIWHLVDVLQEQSCHREARVSFISFTEITVSLGYILEINLRKVAYLSRNSFLHLSHREGSNSSAVIFFCSFLYIALIVLSRPLKLDFNILRKSTFDIPTWKGIINISVVLFQQKTA